MNSRWGIIVTIGCTQALAWASSFYLPAILAGPIARDVGLSPPWIYGALSFSLCVTAALGPLCGRVIDERGGRSVLVISNLLLALGLCLLALARGPVLLFVAWLVLGIAMAAGLYEAAFGALTRLYGEGARTPITGITLIAGFASTVGWPMSAFLEHLCGWRGACISWALLNLLVGLPLNAWALKGAPPATHSGEPSRQTVSAVSVPTDRRMWILAWVFTACGIVSTGIATNLPGLFSAMGVSTGSAVAAASLMGPAQVGARVIEFSARRWGTPLVSARVAGLLHPIGALILGVGGAPMVAVFAIVHGAGNGILTIARGTLPLALFGPRGYGARIGKIAVPARIGQAVAPLLFGVAIEQYGARMLIVSSALSLVALICLFHPSLAAASRGISPSEPRGP